MLFAILLQYHLYVHITQAYIYLLYTLNLLYNIENYTAEYIIMLYILLVVSFSVSIRITFRIILYERINQIFLKCKEQ